MLLKILQIHSYNDQVILMYRQWDIMLHVHVQMQFKMMTQLSHVGTGIYLRESMDYVPRSPYPYLV